MNPVVDWEHIANIGAGIVVGAKSMPYGSGSSEVEQREITKMRERVTALALALGMKGF
jgi:hypothetical protein